MGLGLLNTLPVSRVELVTLISLSGLADEEHAKRILCAINTNKTKVFIFIIYDCACKDNSLLIRKISLTFAAVLTVQELRMQVEIFCSLSAWDSDKFSA